jgi:hypothetical protein
MFERLYSKTIGRIVTFLQSRKESFEEFEGERVRNKAIDFIVTPSKIEALANGKYVTINDNLYSQCIVVGAPSPINPMAPGLSKHFDKSILDQLYDITMSENASISVCQTLILRSHLNEVEAIDKADRAIEEAKETQIMQDGSYSKIYDHAKNDLYEFSKQTYDGEHRTFRQSLLVRVDGSTPEEVSKISDFVQTKFRSQIILCEVPFGGMLPVVKAALPTPEILDRGLIQTFTDVKGHHAAMLWPARNPTNVLSDHGLLLGYHMDSKAPLFIDLESRDFKSKHIAIFGGSGSGKSTLELALDYNAASINYDFIHFVPKEDMGTSHLNAIKALDGQLIKIGDGQDNFNPMMVFYDPHTMGDSKQARRYAYRRHQVSLKKFFELLIGAGFSSAMKSALTATLKATYVESKLIDNKANPQNIDKWSVGESWPSLRDWKRICGVWLKDESKRSKHKSIQALLDNTEDMETGCDWEWMVNKSTFDPKSRFITIDISGLDESVKDAVTVLLIDIINMRLKTPSIEEYKKKRRTIITLDEGANLLKNKRMEAYIERLFREARSGKASIVFGTQDLQGVGALLPVIKANTDLIILMANNSPDNVEEFGKGFKFSDKDKGILMRKGEGKYMIIRGAVKIPGENILTNKLEQIFFGKNSSELVSVDDVSSSYTLDKRVEWVREKGLILQDWVSEMKDVEIEGFVSIPYTPVTTQGSKKAWLRMGLMGEDGLICGETRDHWVTCHAIAGELALRGFTYITVNNWGGQETEDQPDITAISPRGERVWIEYEYPRSHTISKVEGKKKKQVNLCDYWVCVHQASNQKHIVAAVGNAFAAMRGEGLEIWLEKFLLEKQKNIDTTLIKIEDRDSFVSNDTDNDTNIVTVE